MTVDVPIAKLGLKVARLKGFGGKIAAIIISALCALVLCLKYSASVSVQFFVIAVIGLIVLLLLAILFVYSFRHPEMLMLEGAEVVQVQQMRMLHQPAGNKSTDSVPGKIVLSRKRAE